MRPPMTALPVFCAMLLLTACSTAKKGPEWIEEVEGNQLKVYTVTEQKDDGSILRAVNIENTKRMWEGRLKGDKEMLPERKRLLVERALLESRRSCGALIPIPFADPDFVMVDRKTNPQGGGVLTHLLSKALDSAFSEYANLPTAVSYRFVCKDATGTAEKISAPATPAAAVPTP